MMIDGETASKHKHTHTQQQKSLKVSIKSVKVVRGSEDVGGWERKLVGWKTLGGGGWMGGGRGLH